MKDKDSKNSIAGLANWWSCLDIKKKAMILTGFIILSFTLFCFFIYMIPVFLLVALLVALVYCIYRIVLSELKYSEWRKFYDR